MSLSTLYGKMVNLSSNLSSHKSVVLDIPLTFNSALQPVAASAKPENIYPNRPHANTVGSQDKANTSGILRTNRQRGDSEPIKSTVIVEQKKKAVIEPPVDRKFLLLNSTLITNKQNKKSRYTSFAYSRSPGPS